MSKHLDLSVTYYYGQIKPEFRGDSTLFIEIDRTQVNQHPEFNLVSASDVIEYTSKGVHSPLRAYIGVNETSKNAIEERFRKGNLETALDLDVVIVRQEIVQRRNQEMLDLANGALEAAIKTGK